MYASLQRYHLYSLSWALAGTKSAGLAVLDRNAEVACPNGMAYLNSSALLYCDRTYGRCRTDFRTVGTFGTAIAAFVADLRLHEAVQTAAWAQYVVGTGINTELAGRTMGAQIADGQRARRCDELVALWLFFLDDVGKAAVGGFRLHLALCLGESRSIEESDRSQGGTAIGSLRTSPRRGFLS